MFVDEVNLELIAGSGGNGCTAFRREKYVEMGGPYGGNGGHGGNIIFEVDEGLNTLIDLRYKKLYKAKPGAHGQGKACNGANAEDMIIKVPLGTVITDSETGLIIGDLTKKTDRVVAAQGGRGGGHRCGGGRPRRRARPLLRDACRGGGPAQAGCVVRGHGHGVRGTHGACAGHERARLDAGHKHRRRGGHFAPVRARCRPQPR